MKLKLRAWHHSLPLKKPYRLSFTVLKTFETLYIALEGEGRVGFGEITPLPGYGVETIELAISAVQEAARALSAGKPIEESRLSLPTNTHLQPADLPAPMKPGWKAKRRLLQLLSPRAFRLPPFAPEILRKRSRPRRGACLIRALPC